MVLPLPGTLSPAMPGWPGLPSAPAGSESLGPSARLALSSDKTVRAGSSVTCWSARSSKLIRLDIEDSYEGVQCRIGAPSTVPSARDREQLVALRNLSSPGTDISRTVTYPAEV